MNFKVLRTICLAIAAIVMISVNSCNNEENLELESIDNTKYITRSTGIDYSDFLTISTTETAKWTEEDFEAIDKAIERFRIVYSDTENRYKYEISSGTEINISDSLYKCITDMISHTNKIFAEADETKITRMKTRAAESSSSSIPNDCVPAAISHMGKNAPTYENAIEKCDKMFPYWRDKGGVSYCDIKSFIEVYVSVTEYNDLGFFTQGRTSVPNYVTVIGNHAVNAYKISKILDAEIIYYNDYSSSAGSGSGFISGYNLSGIFVFN